MNALARIGAVTRKEFVHLRRDPRALAIVLLLPIIELLLFAYAISFDVSHIPTVVIDRDQTPASRAYVASYEASGLFRVVGEASDFDAVDTAFRTGKAHAAVVVAPGFARALDAGRAAEVAVWLDGSDTNTARIGSAYAEALNRTSTMKVVASWAEARGGTPGASGLVEPRLRTWYNPDRVSSYYLIPGVIVVILMIVTVQQTAVSLVRERDLHTQEQIMLSPLKVPELMIGKLLPWTLIAFADLMAIVAVSVGVFQLPFRGNWLALAVGAALFVFAALGMGLIVSAVAPSAETANILALMVAFLPAFLLSDFAFPLSSTPVVIQWLSVLFPARPMVGLARAVFLKGAGFDVVWPQIAALAAYAVVFLGVATALYRKGGRS